MMDRILLHNMVFQGRHGVHEREQREAQPFQIDVELLLNLQPAGVEDSLDLTVDYGQVFDACRQIVESTSFKLVEALAEAIAHEILADFEPVNEVGVRVRKPEAPITGTFDWVGVEIWRRRSGR